ncbi:uncharacterized protein LOC135849098 [Planococcus citri]|uniref:uncharacterized protein LOC135849098 n=1 Tax=Planococcus citri TaxID=170843 RepID=UPI0031F9D1C9
MGLNETVVLQNIGTAVEALLASPFTSTIVLGGGVAYNDIYVFNRQKYFFANRTGAFTGTTIDGGNGAQLETALIYTNIKYGPLQEAMKYRDGVFEIVTLIRVGECDLNEEFEEFAKYLQYISEPGSAIEMPIVPTWQFYNHFPTNQQYYAMPGAYVNDTTGEQIYCSTLLIIPVTPTVCITERQFDETFGRIKDQNGRQSDTSIQLYPAGDRPVVSTEGIVKITVPLNIVPSVGGYDNSTAPYIGGNDNSTVPSIGGYDNSTVPSIG